MLRRRPGLLWWPLLIVALVVASLVIFWSIDPDEQDLPSRLLSELAAALLGSAVVAVAATFGYFLALSRNRRQRQEQRETARSIERSVRERSLTIGRMTIDDIVVLEASQKLDSYARHVTIEFEPTIDQQRPSAEMREALAPRISALEADARAKGLVFSNDLGIDIVRAGITDRGRSLEGKRKYTFTPAFLRYYDWAASSYVLDDEVSPALGVNEIRSALGKLKGAGLEQIPLGKETTLRSMGGPARIDGLESLSALNSPWPAKLGVGVVVVTSDDQVLLGLRSEQTYVARIDESDQGRRELVHVVAEGAEPRDVDPTIRCYSPDGTARRAVAEELGLSAGPGSVGAVTSLVPTALFIDTKRLQPCFSYVARIDRPAQDVISTLPCARDSWEATRIVSRPVDDESDGLIDLLLDADPKFRLASNHAKAYLYFAMQYLLGFGEMRHLLEGYRSR